VVAMGGTQQLLEFGYRCWSRGNFWFVCSRGVVHRDRGVAMWWFVSDECVDHVFETRHERTEFVKLCDQNAEGLGVLRRDFNYVLCIFDKTFCEVVEFIKRGVGGILGFQRRSEGWERRGSRRGIVVKILHVVVDNAVWIGRVDW